MKKLLFTVLTAALFSACSKSKDSAAGNAATDPAPAPKPTASFRVTNASETNDILELRTLVFQNTSTNAVSYSWDLGDGANFSDGNVDQPMRYSDKSEPANIYMVPCMRPVTITLTVKNKDGVTAVASQTYNVQCFRGTGGRHPLTHRLY